MLDYNPMIISSLISIDHIVDVDYFLILLIFLRGTTYQPPQMNFNAIRVGL